MDFGSILLILALAILVGLFVSRPLYSQTAEEKLVVDQESTQERDRERSTLLAEHERVLAALQELEFDYNLGKIPEEDYPLQRTELLKTGADALRRLDEVQPQAGRETAEDRIEAAIAARRADGHLRRAVTGDSPDDEIEQMIANRRRERQEKSAGFCPHCGKPIQKSDRFCSRCGTTITPTD